RRSRGPSSSTSITACQVPRRSFPARTGMVSPGPRMVAWMCEAALPSTLSWRHTPAGTSRSSASSTSTHTLGSSFSLITIAAVEPRPRDRRRRLAVERGRVAVDVPVRLHVDRAAAHADLDRLIEELARGADRHEREQALDVLGVETHAAVAHLHPDPPRDVRPVDAVERP